MTVDMPTNAPVRPPVEVLHESDRTRVTRECVDDRSVIRKEPRGPDAADRRRHEVAMLDRLRGVDGVVQLATGPQPPGSIMLDDVDGVCMAHQSMPLTVSRLPRVALSGPSQELTFWRMCWGFGRTAPPP